MNFKKVPNLPGAGAASSLVKVAVLGGLGIYGALNSLYNVEGGHRAIVFNRIVGVKNEVCFYFLFMAVWKASIWFNSWNIGNLSFGIIRGQPLLMMI